MDANGKKLTYSTLYGILGVVICSQTWPGCGLDEGTSEEIWTLFPQGGPPDGKLWRSVDSQGQTSPQGVCRVLYWGWVPEETAIA